MRKKDSVVSEFFSHFPTFSLSRFPTFSFTNGALIRECFEKLGQYVKSCHGKDIILSEKFMVHLDETRPGLGGLDYRVYLQELNKVEQDVPLMMEHLQKEEEYKLAYSYIRSVAKDLGINI